MKILQTWWKSMQIHYSYGFSLYLYVLGAASLHGPCSAEAQKGLGSFPEPGVKHCLPSPLLWAVLP